MILWKSQRSIIVKKKFKYWKINLYLIFSSLYYTWSIAATEPAATPAAVNPTPAKTTGVATTAATPVPTAARVLQSDTGHSDK